MDKNMLFDFSIKPTARRRHYLLLWSELLDIRKFLHAGATGLNENLPCVLFLEINHELSPVAIRALPGMPDHGRDLLAWILDWSAGRSHYLSTEMQEMEKLWPDLKYLIVPIPKKRIRGHAVAIIWTRFRKWLLG